MTTETAQRLPRASQSALVNAPVAEVEAAFIGGMRTTAAGVAMSAEAAAVAALRGIPLKCSPKTLSMLVDVYERRIAPAAYVAFADVKPVLDVIRQLGIEEQRRVAVDGFIEIKKPTGKVEKVEVLSARADDLKRAVDPIRGRVIPAAEQVLPKAVTPHGKLESVTLRLTERQMEKTRERANQTNESLAVSILKHLEATGYFK